jgi:16S rRNA (cytidine1402-2'-O)-methyltransferase
LKLILKKNNQTQIFIETPYRNQKLYNDLIKVLNDQTFLCIAINVGSKNQRIKTMSAGNWKTSKIKLSKDPSIFIFHSSFTIF